MSWNDDNVARLRELWDQGLPTAQIGKLLGFTKNAVVGKAHRIGLERRPSPIRRSAAKPDRKKDFTLLIHSTNLWAKNNFNTKKDTVIEQLLDATSGVTGKAIYNAKHIDVHRWKFANIKKQIIKPPFIDQSNRIAACGDWCIKGRIESAFLSGFDLANEMRNLFK